MPNVSLWRIASFCCAASFERYRVIADIEQAALRPRRVTVACWRISTLALKLVRGSGHIRLGCAHVAPLGIVPFARLPCRRERREVPEVERPRAAAPTANDKDRTEAALEVGARNVVYEVRKISELRFLTPQARHRLPQK